MFEYIWLIAADTVWERKKVWGGMTRWGGSCRRRSGRTGTASSSPGCSGGHAGCSWTCCRILGTVGSTEMVLYNLEMAGQTEYNWGNELLRFGRKRSDRKDNIFEPGCDEIQFCVIWQIFFSPSLLPEWHYWVTLLSRSGHRTHGTLDVRVVEPHYDDFPERRLPQRWKTNFLGGTKTISFGN